MLLPSLSRHTALSAPETPFYMHSTGYIIILPSWQVWACNMTSQSHGHETTLGLL